MTKHTLLIFLVLLVIGTSMAAAFVPSSFRQKPSHPLHRATVVVSAIEALLWDMDGVLADTERDAHRPAFNQVFATNKLDTEWTVERYGELLHVGGGKERMTAHWNQVGWPTALADLDAKAQQAKIKEFHLAKTDIFMNLINQGKVPLRPGVERLMDQAMGQGLTVAVCSTSTELAVRNLVQTLLGPDRAAKISIFAGDMVAKKKPAPDVYNLAVKQLNLNKKTCVVIEDSAIGLQAALAAGLTCCVTKSSYTKDEDFTGAALIVDELGNDAATGVTLATLQDLLVSASAVQE